MKKLKLFIAHRLYKLFPSRFCWADLAAWSCTKESWWKVFKYISKPKGCIVESMGKITEKSDCEGCYCGCWVNGHHQDSYQGKKQLEAYKEKQKERDPKELPF